MLTKEDIQRAITRAAESGMGAVAGAAFGQKDGIWHPRPGCLDREYYSSGERIICSILLIFYFEIYGRPEYVQVPDGEWQWSVIDLVWPGAFFFLKAVDNLTNVAGWDAIQMLLPQGEYFKRT